MPLANTQGGTAHGAGAELEVLTVVHLLNAGWDELGMHRTARTTHSQHRVGGYGHLYEDR